MAFVKKTAIILLLLLCCAAFCSCHQEAERPNDSSAADDVAENNLLFRITWTDYSGRGQAISKIVHSYQETCGDSACPVEMIGGDEDSAAIETLLKTGSETIFVLPYRYVQLFGDSDLLMDLTDAFQSSEDLYYPKVWRLGTLNGTVYGIPWLGHSMCLLYNKSLLEQAGVDADAITSPDALAEALEAVEAHTEAHGIGLVGADGNDVSWMVNQFVYGFGGSLVSDDGTAVTINSSSAKDALAFYKDVLGSRAQPTWTEDNGEAVMACFRNQEVAFEIQGIWGVTDIAKNGAPFEVGIINLNQIGLCSEVGPMMLSLPASLPPEQKEEAIRFIQYLISMEAQEDILNGEYSPERDTYCPFRTPIRTDMANCQVMRNYPEYMTFIEGFQNPSVDVPVPAWQKIKDEFYETGLHQVMRDEMSIDEFLTMIETEGNKILREA